MSSLTNVFRNDEKALYSLRELYRTYGYTQYKMGKFEEYDLYSHNKNFLISENILTFTDTNGKLMALKPDVTLSIVKNISSDDTSTHKVYYNENVYRTSAESHGFKEIMQTGLECVGTIDKFAESEVITLAVKSLDSISNDYILDISHMGLLEGLLDAAGIENAERNSVLGFVKAKNITALKRILQSRGVEDSIENVLCEMTKSYLPLNTALQSIAAFINGEKMQAAYSELCGICEALEVYGLCEKVNFDFSVVNDFNYYAGVIFKGFINGIPDSVLSGGRYDRLLWKMGKKCGAIGFAVYLDRLERFGSENTEYDVDIMLEYGNESEKDVIKAVKEIVSSGMTVKAVRRADKSVRYRQLKKIVKGGIQILETND
ncbi:MAG: ATP phosphoribosyltransferase regulatory subunit [Clostridia bacterium]|nr:ATP phosphoribosyltransferase regulatory subunit [Clostridia bacterium]